MREDEKEDGRDGVEMRKDQGEGRQAPVGADWTGLVESGSRAAKMTEIGFERRRGRKLRSEGCRRTSGVMETQCGENRRWRVRF